MDTSILHTRIKEYKAKAKNPVSQEMIALFEMWFTTLENYVADIEIDNFTLSKRVNEQRELINTLIDIIIITGNASKLNTINLEDSYTKEAINLLLRSKDRKNHDCISAIATLLYLNPDEKFNTIKQLKDHVAG